MSLKLLRRLPAVGSFGYFKLLIVKRMSEMRAIARERTDLRNLDEAALRDIGISRTEAERESRRPVWDAPERWHR